MRMGSNGLRVRSSHTTNSATSTRPPTMNSHARPSVHPLCGVTSGPPAAAAWALAADASAALFCEACATRVKP
jgi:hypothetical protein